MLSRRVFVLTHRSVPPLGRLATRAYHENIVEHYENPRNVGSMNKNDDSVGTVRFSDSFTLDYPYRSLHSFTQYSPISFVCSCTLYIQGLVGAPACGDVMKLQIKVDPATGKITESKFKTFGCGSAIASSSVATEWVKGKTVDEVLSIKNTDIASHLKLPPVKLHCSMLAEDAIKAAVADWKSKQELKEAA